MDNDDQAPADPDESRLVELIARLDEFRIRKDLPEGVKAEPGEFVMAVARGDIQIDDVVLRSMLLQKDDRIRAMILQAAGLARSGGSDGGPSLSTRDAMFSLRAIYGSVHVEDMAALMGP